MYMLHREKAFSNMNVCVFLNELEEAPERPWVGLFLVSEKKKELSLLKLFDYVIYLLYIPPRYVKKTRSKVLCKLPQNDFVFYYFYRKP